MLLVILGYLCVFLSVCLRVFYFFRWGKMQNKKRIDSIYKVIILRALGVIFCMVALFMDVNGRMLLLLICLFALVLLLVDVWRLKIQIDETLK